jgi:hypothetical protein
LGAAFLSAGVPAVVVTLWPVDDRVSAALMREFYASLSHGKSVAAALRHAQLRIASRAATAHPFYWAGYVLLGDGGVKVVLERRFPWREFLAGLGFALLALGAGTLWRGKLARRGV